MGMGIEMKNEKILHMFQWRLEDITNALDEVKRQGFTCIQTSPLQGVKEERSAEWWMLYQNINYRIGNKIGSKEDLTKLCSEAHKRGLKIVVDVALHCVGSTNLDASLPSHKVDKAILPYVLNLPNCVDYEDRYQTTHLQVGLPSVDYENHVVQMMHKIYLYQLEECGVDGFRIDMAKHFSLPCEGCDYFTNVYGEFSDKIIYGEILDSDTEVLDMYTEIMDIISNKRPTDTSKLVAFFESHDTYHTFKSTLHFGFNDMIREWNKIVNEDKLNAIFFTRPFSDVWRSKEIREINTINV